MTGMIQPDGLVSVAPEAAWGVWCRETYATKRRLVAVMWMAQGALLAAAGGFLVWNIHIAPQLAMQAAILGGLLSVGGIWMVLHAIMDMTSHLTVDEDGVRGRFGWGGFNLPWHDLRQWRASDHDDRFAGIAIAELWSRQRRAVTIPGGYLDREDRRQLRSLLEHYAPDRERCGSPLRRTRRATR